MLQQYLQILLLVTSDMMTCTASIILLFILSGKHFYLFIFFYYPSNLNKFQIFCQRTDLITQKFFKFLQKMF